MSRNQENPWESVRGRRRLDGIVLFVVIVAALGRPLRGYMAKVFGGQRHGKPLAALVSVEAAEIAQKAMERMRPGLVAYLRTFPGGAFDRNRAPSRDSEL